MSFVIFAHFGGICRRGNIEKYQALAIVTCKLYFCNLASMATWRRRKLEGEDGACLDEVAPNSLPDNEM